jgi:hypothetical protein
MSRGDKDTAFTNFQKHSSKNKFSTPPVYMQQDAQNQALTYIHYDQQPYKETDVYQSYQHKYTTENDPLHNNKYEEDEESLPSLLCPGENEDNGFSDDEYSETDEVPILLERDDDSESEDEEELEIPTAIYDKPRKGAKPTVI